MSNRTWFIFLLFLFVATCIAIGSLILAHRKDDTMLWWIGLTILHVELFIFIIPELFKSIPPQDSVESLNQTEDLAVVYIIGAIASIVGPILIMNIW